MQGLNLKSTGIKRQYHIMKNVIKDSFGKFFSIFKVSLIADKLIKISRRAPADPRRPGGPHSDSKKGKFCEKVVIFR